MIASAFAETSMADVIEQLKAEIKELYTADGTPWIIGYSGGKDSTATLQLIWLALLEVPEEQRTKRVHVISTDTLVENPIVASWVTHSLRQMEAAATGQCVPISPHRLTPRIEDSFWVNLIGKGYPAPRHKFRWCTERLKIKPSNTFIQGVVQNSGEAILVLGTRKAESAARARTMARHAQGRTRDRLSPNASLPGTLVYSPIEAWTNDDVWLFLMQVANPWGYNNKDLLGMYAGASADGECPLVVDTSTPSCGDSRFGCWVCTLVEKDKSMTAMIQNDAEKEWMLPLLELRNALDFRNGSADAETGGDRHLRDFRRMNGTVQLFHGRPIPGPYTQDAREGWLTKLLEAQEWIREHGPHEVRGIELITHPELQEIRRIWVVEKHEIEDRLPVIFNKVTGRPYDEPRLDDAASISGEDVGLLKELCGKDRLHFELTRELLSLESQHKTAGRRAGLYQSLAKALSKHFYDDAADAAVFAARKKALLDPSGPPATENRTDVDVGS
jgi:DNA sulfur modification protein DndC